MVRARLERACPAPRMHLRTGTPLGVQAVEECVPYRGRPTVTWIHIDGLLRIENVQKLGETFGSEIRSSRGPAFRPSCARPCRRGWAAARDGNIRIISQNNPGRASCLRRLNRWVEASRCRLTFKPGPASMRSVVSAYAIRATSCAIGPSGGCVASSGTGAPFLPSAAARGPRDLRPARFHSVGPGRGRGESVQNSVSCGVRFRNTRRKPSSSRLAGDVRLKVDSSKWLFWVPSLTDLLRMKVR